MEIFFKFLYSKLNISVNIFIINGISYKSILLSDKISLKFLTISFKGDKNLTLLFVNVNKTLFILSLVLSSISILITFFTILSTSFVDVKSLNKSPYISKTFGPDSDSSFTCNTKLSDFDISIFFYNSIDILFIKKLIKLFKNSYYYNK